MPVGAKYKPKDKNELLNLLKDGIECRDIDFSLLDDLSSLFYDKRNILLQDNVYFVDPNEPDLLIWNTFNVTNMEKMFAGCKIFNKPVKLDTSNVTNMYWMFNACKIFNQPLNFDTSNVTNMSGMFINCENFNQPLNFNTSNVTDMSNMFYECKKFNQPVNFDTSNVTNMSNMFDGCEEFNQPINFDTSNVISMSYMFNECKNFNQPINFDVSNVKNMTGMFNYCKNLNSKIELKNIGKNVDEVLISFLFDGCEKLKLINIDLDITDCNKIKGYDIYKDMRIQEFCEIFGKNKKSFNINDIINKLNDLML